MNKFPFFRQLDYRDCGPTCLRMVAKFHGKTFSREFLRDKAGITRMGVTMAGIADAAEAIEMRTLGMRIALELAKLICYIQNRLYSDLPIELQNEIEKINYDDIKEFIEN